MKKLFAPLLGLLGLLAVCCGAAAQSSPGLVYGQVPTAGQWNSYFAAKQDYLGFTPLNPSSIVGTAPIVTSFSGGVLTLGLNIGSAFGVSANNLVLANTGVAAATYGDSTHVGQFAVNAQGQITSAANVAVVANQVDVFAIGGQSNAQGTGSDVTLSPAVPAAQVLQYSGGVISAGNDPVGAAGGSGSAWPAFGVAYYNATGRRVMFVPSAVGGTDQCATTGVSATNWSTTGTLAPALVANVTAAMAAARTAGYSPTYRGILWSQGENDAAAIGTNATFPTIGATTVTGGPYSAGTTAITIASATGVSTGEFAVISLDNGTTFTSAITVSGLNITLTTAVPAGRAINTGATFHIYSKSDYAACFRAMANFFRTTTTDSTTFPDLPIYISTTGAPQSGDNLGYQKVRAAQEEVAQSDRYTRVAYRGAVDFIARNMMQPASSLHYLQEGYNEMGEMMAQGVVSAQSGQWLRQSYNVYRVTLGGTLRNGDNLTVTATSTALTNSPWAISGGNTSLTTFCPVANNLLGNSTNFSPNLAALGVTVTMTCSATGAVITYYQPVSVNPQVVFTGSWITGGATETMTITTGTSAGGNAPDIYYDKGTVTIGPPFLPPTAMMTFNGINLPANTINSDFIVNQAVPAARLRFSGGNGFIIEQNSLAGDVFLFNQDNSILRLGTNNTDFWDIGTVGGLFANGLTAPPIGVANTKGLQINSAAPSGHYPRGNGTSYVDAVIAAGDLPAFGSADVSFASGGGAGTIAASAVTNAKLANMNANTIKANNTGGAAAPTDVTPGQLGAMLCAPQVSVFTTGTDATYTTPTCNSVTAKYIEIEMVGGGGGGAGSGTTPGAATAGGNTCWKASGTACTSPLYVANGGALGSAAVGTPAAGGAASGCDDNITGQDGAPPGNVGSFVGGVGGASFFGGAGVGGAQAGGAPGAAKANTGSGGGGASETGTNNSGGGGAASGLCRVLLASPAASYVYTVGAAGVAGTAGTGGGPGAAGAAGRIKVTAHFQ